LCDYQEWVLSCLDYVFLSLAAHHGPAVFEPVVSLGFFEFSTFQKHFAEGEPSDADEESPEALDRLTRLLLDMLPAGPEAARELDLIDFLLNSSTPDLDYVYVDGQGFCEKLRQKQARERALRLIDHCPDEAEYHRRLGFSLLMLGEFANALVCFGRQQRHAPDDGVIFDNIAWCQMKLGWLNDALASGKKALARVPEKPDVYHDYAGVLLLRGQLEDALEVTSRALATFPEPPLQLYYLHALLLDRAGRADEAVGAWLGYLKRAREGQGHRKVVARALAALETLGRSYSVTRYPMRTIAEQTIQAVSKRVEEVQHLLQEHGVSFSELENLERELAAMFCVHIDALENRCRELVDQSEEFLTSELLLSEEGQRQIRAMFGDWRHKREEHAIPYYVVLRDGVKPLLQQLASKKPFWIHLSGLSQQQAVVEHVVRLGGWKICRELLKKPRTAPHFRSMRSSGF
jgi:tetratricopeptide (TPR) repeat protein